MQYVIMKDYETNEIDLIGRFKNKGIGEIWQNGKWIPYSNLISDLLDGSLENITEVEARSIIAKITSTQLQAV